MNEEDKKIEKSLHMLKIISRGLGYQKDSQGFFLAGHELDLDSLLDVDTLSPILFSMIDMHYRNIGLDPDFETFFPIQLEKKTKSLCFAVVKAKPNFDIEKSAFSRAVAGCVGLDIVEKVLMPNPKNQVMLDPLVKMWRKELAPYKEGEVIDIKKHFENLFEGNLCLYPKLREDLSEERKNDLRKDLFSK
jgi:hypothetical protein